MNLWPRGQTLIFRKNKIIMITSKLILIFKKNKQSGQHQDFIYYFWNYLTQTLKKKKSGLTPDTCPEGELVFEQSSELDEDVDVGVIVTELLFPEKKIK